MTPVFTFVAVVLGASVVIFILGMTWERRQSKHPDAVATEMWDNWREELIHLARNATIATEVRSEDGSVSLRFSNAGVSDGTLQIVWCDGSEQAWAAPRSKKMLAAPLYPALYVRVKREAAEFRAKEQKEITEGTNAMLEVMRAADKQVPRGPSSGKEPPT